MEDNGETTAFCWRSHSLVPKSFKAAGSWFQQRQHSRVLLGSTVLWASVIRGASVHPCIDCGRVGIGICWLAMDLLYGILGRLRIGAVIRGIMTNVMTRRYDTI